jgi:hypothetical protein
VTADEVQPGQVVKADDGTVFQLITRDNGHPMWGAITPVGFEGSPFNPEGELTLLVPAES